VPNVNLPSLFCHKKNPAPLSPTRTTFLFPQWTYRPHSDAKFPGPTALLIDFSGRLFAFQQLIAISSRVKNLYFTYSPVFFFSDIDVFSRSLFSSVCKVRTPLAFELEQTLAPLVLPPFFPPLGNTSPFCLLVTLFSCFSGVPFLKIVSCPYFRFPHTRHLEVLSQFTDVLLF